MTDDRIPMIARGGGEVDRRTIQDHRNEAFQTGWDDGYAEGFGKAEADLRADEARLTARLAASDNDLARECEMLFAASAQVTAERDALTLDRQDLVAENRKLARIAEEAVRERDEAREALRPFAELAREYLGRRTASSILPDSDLAYTYGEDGALLTLGDLRRARAALAAQAPATPRDAALAERERIAQRLEEEADMLPCAEDAAVTRGNAMLVRADFSYDEAERLVAAPSDNWLPIDSAPRDGTAFQARISGHGQDNIIAWYGGLVGEDGEDCGNWSFAEGQEPPDDWSDGVCWASNEDGEPSTHPTHWKPLAATPSDGEGGDA